MVAEPAWHSVVAILPSGLVLLMHASTTFAIECDVKIYMQALPNGVSGTRFVSLSTRQHIEAVMKTDRDKIIEVAVLFHQSRALAA
jgi:hypothetical protein